MTTAVESLRADLVSLAGEAGVVTDPITCEALAVDGRIPGGVLYPSTGEQVAAMLRYAAGRDLAIIPCGSATKLATGNPPRRYDLALSLRKLNQVHHYEPADLTITVEAGMTLGDFQQSVGRDGLWLPLDPTGGSRASIGGILAANAAGPLRLRFGGPRDMVLGMKIATTEGKVVKTGGRVVKNVAGYDFGKLLVGSYGTLGVIVEASFKLFPLPQERVTFVLRAGTLGIARELRRSILNSPLEPLRMVLLDAPAAALVRTGTLGPVSQREPELWLEAGGSKRVIERSAHDLGEMARATGAPLSHWEAGQAEPLWQRVADFHGWLEQAHPALVVLKAALPIAASEEFLSRFEQEAQGGGLRAVAFSQAGVGIVRVCLLQEKPAAGIDDLVTRLRQAARDLDGSLVVEQAPLELKQRLDVWGTPGDDFEAMRQLKSAWDPKGVLSPGRFLGGL